MGITAGNFDLLAVGVAAGAMFITGFVTFFNNRKSISAKFFLCFAVIASAWSVVNYASYQTSSIAISFWMLRLVMFFGVWSSFFTFTLAYVFPTESTPLPKLYKWGLVPVTAFVSILSLTSFVFSQVANGANGHVARVVNGPGIIVFAITIAFLNLGGVVFLIKRALQSSPEERSAIIIFLVGFALTLGLILVYNFILPAFFEDTNYISMGGLFLFPFVIFTAYAILRHHLFNIKIFATEILAFVLSVVSLSEIIFSSGLLQILFRIAIFVLTLIFGILLIQSVQHEVEQREELQILNAKIAADNKQLEELGRFKSQLLSLASHQIRSPLAAMKGFITLVQGGSYGEVNDKVKETLGKVQKSADELIGLINTLLDVRKVEEGKMEYAFEKTDLVPIVTGIVDGIMPLAQAKKLTLSADLPKEQIMVNIDKEKFKQVVQNLVDNAIKYTPAGYVKVMLSAEGGKARIAVSDSGYGIPASLIPFLFEEFIRDERIKKEVRGTGLGLYIARKIAEAHGGMLTAASPGEGRGSTFTAVVPLAR